MTNNLNRIIFILNYIIFAFVIFYTVIFFLEIKFNFISNTILSLSAITILLKFFYWYLIKNVKFKTDTHILILRLFSCILLYITPSYYILQYPYLTVNNSIILITLIIISVLTFFGLITEKYSNIFKINQ